MPDEPLAHAGQGEDDEDPALNEDGCQRFLVGNLPQHACTPLSLCSYQKSTVLHCRVEINKVRHGKCSIVLGWKQHSAMVRECIAVTQA